MPKIVEESAVSTHSEMNTSVFLSYYAREHHHTGRLCSAGGRNCSSRLCDSALSCSSYTSSHVSPVPVRVHNLLQRPPQNHGTSELKGDFDPDASTHSVNCKSSITVYDGLLDSQALPSSHMASTILGEGPNFQHTLTELKNK